MSVNLSLVINLMENMRQMNKTIRFVNLLISVIKVVISIQINMIPILSIVLKIVINFGIIIQNKVNNNIKYVLK